MKMELLCLLMFVVTWIAYVKLQRFYKLNVKGVIKRTKEELLTFENCVRFEDG